MKKNILTYITLLSVILPFYSQYADLSVTITTQNFNLPVPVGSTQSYTVEISNLGPDTAENVSCTSTGGSCFGFVSATTSIGSFENNVWSIGSLPNGATVSLTITNIMNTTCNCEPVIYQNVTSTTTDPISLNNFARYNYDWDYSFDLDLQCTPYEGNLFTGSTIYLTYNLVNLGINDICSYVYFYNINGLSIVNGITTNGVWNNQLKSWQSILSQVNQSNSLQLECVINDIPIISITGLTDSDIPFDISYINNTCSTLFNNLATTNNQYKDAITVSPNPVDDILNISISDKNIKSMVLFDIFGKKIMEISNEFNQIDVSNLQIGLYLLKAETESGESQIFKVLKE